MLQSFCFQIDLVDDIPNQEDEDMDDVTIIEPVRKINIHSNFYTHFLFRLH